MLRNYLKKLIPTSADNVGELRTRVVESMILGGAVLALPAVVAVAYRAMTFGGGVTAYISLCVYLLLVLMAVLRRKVPLAVRFSVCLGAVAFAGLSGIFVWGLFASGFLTVFFCVILAATIYGLRWGLSMTGVGVTGIALAGWGYSSGRLEYLAPVEVYAVSATPWIIWVSMFSVFGVVATLILTWMHSSFSKAISAAKESETELARVNADLQKQAEELKVAMEAKDRFLSVVSHELRTPLNPIKGFLALLSRDSELNQASRSYVSSMESASEQLLRMIDYIVGYSDADTEEIVQQPTLLKLNELVYEISCRLRPKAQARKLGFEIEISRSCSVLAKVDGRLLEQIIGLLLDDAIDCSTEGLVRLSSTLRSESGVQRTLRIGVHFEGDVLQEYGEYPFDVFKGEPEAEMTLRLASMGLGLARCKRIVTAMGGTMNLSQVQPKGRVVEIDLEIEVKQEEGVGAAELPVSTPWNNDKRPEVLVVEDDFINQKVAAAILKSLGVDSTCVNDGQMALDALKEKRFDLVLMDLNMPNMDGVTATREIRKRPELAGVSIVGLSANAQANARLACFEAGMNRFLPKPVRRDTLAAVLAELLGKAAVMDSKVG